jgi:hypothetical protein
MLFAIALTSVLSVDIDAHSSYKGRTTRQTIMRITRNGDDFVANGTSVSASAVQALVDALEAPPMNAPTPEALRVGIAELAALEPGAMHECEGVDYAQGAQAAFHQRFTDMTAFANVARVYYAKPDPNLSEAKFEFKVAVRSNSGTVAAESQSSMADMLPFTITRNGVPSKTYNAQIPTAIAALLPMQQSWGMLLGLDSLNIAWRGHVCNEDMTDLAFREVFPQTTAFAQEHGLVLHGRVLGDPKDSVQVRFWRADNPRITMFYNGGLQGAGDMESARLLLVFANKMHRVAVIPWLQRALSSNPEATVNIDDPSMAGSFLEQAEVEELQNAGFGRAASLLSENLRNAPSFWVWLKPDKEATHWYLLPNGDALLSHYLPAEERLPFDQKMSATIHARGKPFDKTPTITVGAVVTPAGTLEP